VITDLKATMVKKYIITRVTYCKTFHTSVTEFAPYVQRHHHVIKIGQSIVLQAKGGFSTRNVSESFDSQIERQVCLSVETGMPKL